MEKQDRQWMMNQTYVELVKEIRQDLKYEIQEYIWQRTSKMEKLLENGLPIWANAKGESFNRISYARHKVYTKIHTLRELCFTIIERY